MKFYGSGGALFATCLLAVSATVHAQKPADHETRWIDRPWEYRYLLYTRGADSWSYARQLFANVLAQGKNPGEFGEPLEVHFDPSPVIQLQGEDPGNYLGVQRLDVDQDRTIQQLSLRSAHLRPRLTELGHIVLTPSDANPQYVVRFGFFFMGAYGASDARYSPAICSGIHRDSTPADGIGRYKPKDDPTGLEGFFGCREWAAQLYDDRRPYIDVTSYEMVDDYDRPAVKGKLPKKPETFIRPFVGFSRFDSPVKPVIGNHKGTWYCITDCPNGDSPGPIADMKAWVKRGGWSMPAKPKNVREFMDTPVKRGEVQE